MKKGKKILAGALSLAIVLSGLGYPSGNVKAAETRQLVWSDEFDGSTLDKNKWTYETGSGGWGNNEYEYYTDRTDNVSVSNGNLNITAKKESYQGSNYTSGRIKTAGKAEFKYGRIEAKIKMPSGSGLWPAFWMLGGNIEEVTWPRCGEIDIMEHINTENKVYGTAHWQSSTGYKNISSNMANIDVTQYHVYAVDWNENNIIWTVDGNEFNRVSIGSGSDSMEEFHKKQFILFNLAVGGNLPGFTIDDTKMPATMSVDYVKVYQTPTEAVGNYGTLQIDDSTNLIKNPNFKYGTQGWTTYIGNSWMYARAYFDPSLNPGISIKMKNIGGWLGTDTKWGVQLYQDGIHLQGGQSYSLKYKIYSNKDKNVSVYVTDADTSTTYYTGEYKMSAYETKNVLVNLNNISGNITNGKIAFAVGSQGDDPANGAAVLNITELKIAKNSEIGTLTPIIVPTITPLLATGNYAAWKNTAIIYPQAGQLVPAGPIDIQWNNLKDVTRSYGIYVDNNLVATVNATTDNVMTYKLYLSDVKQHELKIVANLNSGSGTVTANLRTFFTSKKGIGSGEVNYNEDTGISWYYHWSTDPLPSINPLTEFIPMIWGRGDYGTNFLANPANKKYKAILGYNEPDFTSQSNVTPDVAAADLVNFVNSGIRVGSPATAIPINVSPWFSDYWTKIRARNLDVGFIAFHVYMDQANADSFLNLIDSTYQMYGKPIWITEFGCAEWTNGTFSGNSETAKANVRAFMSIVLPELDKRAYVERYAWFPFDDSDAWGGASGLYDVGTGKLDQLGMLYRSLGNPAGYVLPQLDGYKPITDFPQDAIVDDVTGVITRPGQTVTKVATPSVTPVTGTYTSARTVTITNGTPGAAIRYTTDGSTPTATAGTVYTVPFTVSATATVKAIAFLSGMTDSDVATSTITISGPINLNIALNKTATASSSIGGNTAAMAFDADSGTRWESAQGVDPQWITVDLGSRCSLTGVKLIWETAAAKDYKIQVSTDNTAWVDAYTKTGGTGGTENISFTAPVTGRYVRMYGTARTTVYGHSLWGFEVYGTPEGTVETVGTPVITPATGTYTVAQTVTISDATAGTTIRYTTDGSTPTETSGTVYSGAFTVVATATVKAIAYKSGMTNSSIATATITINNIVETVATPVILPATGTYTAAQTVTIADSTAGATIRYTTDGSTPTETSGTLYSAAFTVAATATVKAIAYKSGMTSSNIASSTITINIAPITSNVALNKTATASSVLGGNTAAMAFDADSGTRWESTHGVDPQWIAVDLGASCSLTGAKLIWETAAGKDYKIQVSTDNNTWVDVFTKTNGTDGTENITFATPVTGRYVRMYGTARTTGYGYSLWGFEVYGTTSTVNTNLALQKTATASSTLGGNTAAMAFDSNSGTRWESTNGVDPQWISVDLGSNYSVKGAKLTWETAAAKDYKIQVSMDNITWVDAFAKTGGTGGIENITFTTAVTGRYVRMYGTARTTGYGYSLWEFEVY